MELMINTLNNYKLVRIWVAVGTINAEIVEIKIISVLKKMKKIVILILNLLDFAKIILLKLISVFIFNLIWMAFAHKMIRIQIKIVNCISIKEVQILDVLRTILFKMIMFRNLIFTDVIMHFAHWIRNQ